MNAATSTRRDAGFSFLEVLIGTGIVLAVMAASMGAQTITTGLMNETVARSALQESALFGIKEVAYDVRWCDSASLVMSTLNSCSRLDLRIPVSYSAGAPVWSSTITYKVIQSPTDSNGNGVLDEWELVRVQSGVQRVICDNLISGGFTATKVGSKVTLQLRTSRTYKTRPLAVTVSSTSYLRN